MEKQMSINDRLKRFPRARLVIAETPVERLDRMSALLDIDLWLKRDDLTGLGLGGNKNRQLEFYFGEALAQGADTVLITGAVQSNFVRLCAAATRKLGWLPVVQLENRVQKNDQIYKQNGNVLIDQLLGAEIHYFPQGEDEAAADSNLDRIAELHRQAGRKPYVIHLGIDHPPLGGLGYALAAVETYLQFKDFGEMPDHVVIPSGSGLTHAGFLAGARSIGWQVPVYGICVRRQASQQFIRVLKRAKEISLMLGGGAEIVDSDILVDDTNLHPGYGQMNDAVLAAIHQTAKQEAILLDPVYSGRCMAGLVSLVENYTIERGARVLFVHTGGIPAIFAYQNDLIPKPDGDV